MNKINKSPLISVIVTTYNRKELLKETIDSILNQTFKDFELIVVDNFSNYDFFAHINSFNDSRIRPFQNQNNGIIAVNRNFGIKKAKGEYIAFCDDDDLWKPEKLSKQLDCFRQNDVVAVGTKSELTGFLDYHRKKKESGAHQTGFITFDTIIAGNSAPLSSLLVKNTGSNLQFNEDKKYLYVEDFLFQLQLTENGNKIFILDNHLIYYRVHNENNSSSAQKAKNVFNVLDLYKKKIEEGGFAKLKAKRLFGIGLRMLRAKEGGAVKYFIVSLKLGDARIKAFSFFMIIVSILPKGINQMVLKAVYKFK